MVVRRNHEECIQGLFINYWDIVNYGEHGRDTNLILHDWTHLFLLTCKLSVTWLQSSDRREQKKSITWRYAEHSDVANVTPVDYNGVTAIVTASLLLNVHTMQSSALHISEPTFIYICSVNVLCADSTAMLFHSAIPLTVWRVPCCSEFNTFDVKLSVITVCLPFIFELSMPRNLLCHR